jgi:23S rRNA (cytosine1962-C5)-methyltransferase
VGVFFSLVISRQTRYETDMEIQTITVPAWDDYALLGTGNRLRYERVAGVTVVRPEPHALWGFTGGVPEADAFFDAQAGREPWQLVNPDLANGWKFHWNNVTLRVEPTPFRHLGVFPEQSWHWGEVQKLTASRGGKLRVLNLFGYTGGLTVAAALAGAEVTHVDAAKGSVLWAAENAKLSGVKEDHTRWITEDVRSFVAREVRREKEYDLIVLDPPVFGRGNKGQIWRLDEDLVPLLKDCKALLSTDGALVCNFYATERYPQAMARTIFEVLERDGELASLALADASSPKNPLPTGFFVRTGFR